MKNEEYENEMNEVPPLQPSLVGPLILVAGIAVVIFYVFYHRLAPVPPGAALAPAPAATPQPLTPSAPVEAIHSLAAAPGVNIAAATTAVAVRRQALLHLSQSGNPAAMAIIAAELTNEDPRIRTAAREAAVQLGNRDMLSALQSASYQTDDPQEKIDLQNAADFLRLPSLTDSASETPP